MKFEAFGSSPEFTSIIQKFMCDNCQKFEEANENGEHCHNNFLLYQEYSKLMENEIKVFLDKEKIDQNVFLIACEFARDENLPCSFLDYVLSSIEYEDFYFLMMDHKNMQNKALEETNNEKDDNNNKNKVKK